MIALTDEALARVAIAATAVPAEDRGLWLERVAAELERSAERDRVARKQRRYRLRQARKPKQVVYLVTAHEEDVVNLLVSRGRLADKPSLSRTEVEAALSKLIDDEAQKNCYR